MKPLAIVTIVVVTFLGVDELEPSTMRKGEVGTLPKATPTRFYEVCDVYEDDVLVVTMEQRDGVIEPGARFFFKDADAVARFKGLPRPNPNLCLSSPISLTGIYQVIGTKTAQGRPIPRIAVKK